ncbi:hypothetical protein Syn7803US50_100 [Synechococcus phage ACG-2014f]|uniref:Uncharacterized protein n=1 Tax=Synechococcus phage ACG-2014f TaxID=1493511 RepID=A0A0E3FSC9_9CAUD|nr:hypothetical protein Syn7803US50_100 [Synechococcus phage ACG-2014f]
MILKDIRPNFIQGKRIITDVFVRGLSIQDDVDVCDAHGRYSLFWLYI